MKLSFDWLSDYIDLSGISPEQLAEKFTMNAFEVEGIDVFGPDLKGPIVVGEIVDIQAHPDPKVSKMRVTKIIVEEGQAPLQIVCGASNILVGQRIPVALPGSLVINRHDGSAFPITKADKRGVESNGMLCAAAEIGITDSEVDGILILDPALATKLGVDIKKLLCLDKDYVLTVASRSNRGDAVSVRGLAREVSALFKRPLREPKWQLNENGKTNYSFTVKIDDIKDCEYFSIRSMSNIRVKNSPPFIVRRLAAVGSRSINNLVDITNYVMHEWGQPMHAYDARVVKDGKFHVRRGKQDEKYITLDGKERVLTPEILIISDSEKVIGMPIMGGANSEISEGTTDIALEAASFLPATVRRSSRLLGLSSESSLRFERGVDAATTKQASDRAAYLISRYCSEDTPVKVGPYVFGGKTEFPQTKVELRTSEIKRHLDLDLSQSEIKDLLGRLEFHAIDSVSKPDKLVFAIPSFRQNDVQREIDLIEEVCRIYGYNNIPDKPPSFLPLSIMPDDIKTTIRKALSGQGLCEAYVKSFVPQQQISSNNLNGKSSADSDISLIGHDSKRSISVLNTISPDHQLLRQSLLPGLINALKYNRDRGEENVWLFEMGFAYFKHKTNEKSSSPTQEDLKVSGVLSGTRHLSTWHDASAEKDRNASSKIDFYTVKGIVENLFQSLYIPIDQIRYSRREEPPPLLHPGKVAKITYESLDQPTTDLGWLGQLHPAHVKDMDLDPQTFLFELDVEALKKLRGKSIFTPIAVIPPVVRDLTVDLPSDIENIVVTKYISEAATNLKNLELVSIFPLSSESKSLSYRLTFQSDADTFKSEEIEQLLNKVRKTLKEKLNASFRA